MAQQKQGLVFHRIKDKKFIFMIFKMYVEFQKIFIMFSLTSNWQESS